MQREHTVPTTWDDNWILRESGEINTFNVSRGQTTTTIRYTGSQAQFDAIEAVISEYPSRYLTEVLAPARWEEVKRIREERVNSVAMTPSGAVQTDESSRLNLAGSVLGAVLAKMASSSFSVEWTMANNTPLTLNADQVITVGVAVLQHVDACWSRGRALRTLINAAETLEELEAIDINSGWPS